MKAHHLTVHNFRSVEHVEIEISDYSLLVGPNNAGKSNVLAAIRAFYEKDLKYDEGRDFPKFSPTDQESWVEIEFEPSPDEFDQLKDEYKLPGNRFRVRKYFKSSQLDGEGKQLNGIYAYVGGKLSTSRFYGAKNVQHGKLGDVIYIPAVSKLDEHTKLTGPSALRDLLNAVLKGALAKSPSYDALVNAFRAFGATIRDEEAKPGWSISRLETEISKELEDWGLQFALQINSPEPDEIIKSLVDHHIIDGVLGTSLSPAAFGQGFQRHLVFALIRLAAAYEPTADSVKKKEFSPRMTWVLFEEPEAFLHPAQMGILDANLRTYAEQAGQQVTICTHSPHFASRSMEEVPAVARLDRIDAKTSVGQVRASELSTLLAANQVCVADLRAAGIDVSAEDETIEMESIKYALWLNPLRAGAFFAERVLLVEGPTEYALINYLLSKGVLKNPKRGITTIDTLGKWNMHRFVNLLGVLRVPHSVLYDRDGGSAKSVALEKALYAAKNAHTRVIAYFDDDLETFLRVRKSARPDRKPQHLMWHLQQGHVAKVDLEGLAIKIQPLLDI